MPNGGINPATLTGQSVYLIRSSDNAIVLAVLNTSGGGDVIVLRPESLLASNTGYTFVVTEELKDIAGAAFIPFSMSFMTGTTVDPGDDSVAFERIQIPAAVALAENYTAVTTGPDGKLYAGTVNGNIYRFTINANGTLADRQLIQSLQIANQGTRLLVGMRFDPSCTASNLILYVSHSIFAFSGAADWGGKREHRRGCCPAALVERAAAEGSDSADPAHPPDECVVEWSDASSRNRHDRRVSGFNRTCWVYRNRFCGLSQPLGRLRGVDLHCDS